jgi:hypothetical protein
MALTRFNAERDGEALSEAYNQGHAIGAVRGYEAGVRDTLARLTGPEVVAAVAVAEWRHDPPRRHNSGDIVRWDQLTPFQVGQYEARARITLSAVAAALAPREETEA